MAVATAASRTTNKPSRFFIEPSSIDLSIPMSSASLERKIVERDDAVRLGPKAHLACVRECLVIHAEHFLAIDVNGEKRILEGHSQSVPNSSRHMVGEPV